MKLDAVEGVEVTVEVGGTALQEYEANGDELDIPDTATKYIQATSGEAFSVRFAWRCGDIVPPDHLDEVAWGVYIDGRFARGRVCDVKGVARTQESDSMDGVPEYRAGQGSFIRPFLFSTLTTGLLSCTMHFPNMHVRS
jgi:hypothetical protein